MISYRLRATPQRRKCFSIFLAYSPVAHSFRLSSRYPPQYRIFGYFLSRGELYFRQYSLLASFTRFCACGAETALDDIALSITRIDKRKEEGTAHLQLLQKKKKKRATQYHFPRNLLFHHHILKKTPYTFHFQLPKRNFYLVHLVVNPRISV